jgi:hypothetical protein
MMIGRSSYGLIEVLPRKFLGRGEKDYRRVSLEIRTERLPNTSLERYRCSDFLGRTSPTQELPHSRS